MTICKHYDEATAGDFKRLFVERFPDGDPAILETCLANPARRNHPSTGSIAYGEDGSVKAILGLVPRRIYWGQTPLGAANGVAIAVKKDADRAFFPDFIRDAVRENGADLFFVNTAIPPSRKRVKAVLGVEDGPASCAEIRERALRSNGLFARVMRKIGAKFRRCAAGSSSQPYQAGFGRARSMNPFECGSFGRARSMNPFECGSFGRARSMNPFECGSFGRARSMIAPDSRSDNTLVLCHENEISDTDFNAFWQSYLKTNRGLVSSRTAEELRWVFGKGLASGEVTLITARNDGALQGYAFCRRTDETATCWRVVDLIARGSDEMVLAALIEGSSRFLRQCTPALCLQITGYPTWVQPLLKRLFPKSSSFGFNKCIWVCLNDQVKSLCGDWVNAPNGWYGCPYDGDMCLM